MPNSVPKQMRSIAILVLNTVILLFLLSSFGCSGENSSDFQSEGRKLMEQDNPGGAVVFFKNALEKDPTNFSVRFDLGKAYFKLGKIDQAAEEFKKCHLQQPENIELNLELAKLNTLMRKPDQALIYIAKIEQAQKPSSETREIAAYNFLTQGKVAESEKALKEALEIDPKNHNAALRLVQVYLVQRQPKEALELTEAVLKADPSYSDAWRMRAEIAMRTNDMDKAEECYRNIIKLSPGDAGATYGLGTVLLHKKDIAGAKKVRDGMRAQIRSSAIGYMLSGMIAYEEGDFRSAANLFQNSVDLAPAQESYHRLAIALNRMGNHESALSNLRKILDTNPKNANAMLLTGQILFDMGRVDEAFVEIKRLTAYYPQSAAGFYLLGTILNAKGETKAALEALEKALEINPAMSDATMRRSSILMAEHRIPEAVDELSKAIKVNTSNIIARVALFNYYLGKRDITKAEEIVSEGLEELPNNSTLLTLKASLQASRKENDAALATLGQVRTSDPDFLPAISLLLRLHMLADRNQEALAVCNDYLSRYPEDIDQLITSAALLDSLNRPDEAKQRLEKANKLGSLRALVFLVRRELIAQQPDKAEQYLLDKLKQAPSRPIRSLLAEFYLEQKTPEKAIALYDILPSTEETETVFGKYHIFMTLARYDEALLQTKKMKEIDPKSSVGPMSAAAALEQAGKKDKAFQELEDGYRQLQDPQLLVAIGSLCLRMDQHEKAESYFRTALLKNPDNLQALMGQGLASLQKKNFPAAITSYEKALKVAPDNFVAINNLAMAIAEEGKNTARAVDLATKIFVTHPEDQRILDTLGFCLLADQRVKEALAVLKNGIKAHPDSAIIHFRYGMALLANGQKKEGVAALEKSLQLGDFTEKETASKMIRQNK